MQAGERNFPISYVFTEPGMRTLAHPCACNFFYWLGKNALVLLAASCAEQGVTSQSKHSQFSSPSLQCRYSLFQSIHFVTFAFFIRLNLCVSYFN